jgi:MFS family permease
VRLVNPQFARLWYGQAVSTVGDFVFDTTLVLWVATVLVRGKPWAPAAVSGILFAIGAAVFVVGPVAGVLVDRWDRLRTLLATEVVRAVLVAVLAGLSLLPVSALPLWLWLVLVYLVAFGVTVGGQFFNPARLAIIGQIVPGEVDRARAAGIEQATLAVASIAGPPLAAPLLFGIGVQWALWLNVATYLISYLAIRTVRVSALPEAPAELLPGAGTLRADFVAGLRYFATNRTLVVLLVVSIIAQFGTGALNALDVFFVTANLHTDANLYGLLSTGAGIGAIAGALVAAGVVRRIGARNTTVLSLLLTGLFVIGYARQSTFVAAVVLLALVMVPVGMINTAIAPLLLGIVPQQYLGRVLGVFNPLSQLAGMVSVGVAGWLASTVLRDLHASVLGVRFGTIDTVFVASGVLILLAFGYAAVALPAEPATEPAAGAATEPASGAADAAAAGDEAAVEG